MKSWRKLFAPALIAAGVAAMVSAPAAAVTLNTSGGGGGDGILQNFTGFDWHDDAQALIQGFGLTSSSAAGTSDAFTLDYHGFASAILTSTSFPGLVIPVLANGSGGTGGLPGDRYEITLVAHLDETGTCVNAGCNSIALQTNGGTFAVYIDYTPDASPSTGTGYADTGSIQILGGILTAGFGSFQATGSFPTGLGSGSSSILGLVTFSNPTFVSPTLLGAGAVTQTSLQFAAATGTFPQTSDYSNSGCFELAAAGPVGAIGGPCTPAPVASSTSFQLQADASTTFTAAAVPEPTTLALLGISLLGIGVVSKKRKEM